MKSDKFVVDAADLEIYSEKDISKKMSVKYDETSLNKLCAGYPNCAGCSKQTKEISGQLSQVIFRSYFHDKFDQNIFELVVEQFEDLCRKVISDEKLLTHEIVFCAKVAFAKAISERFIIDLDDVLEEIDL